jgi:segregation and condensation protein B
MWHARIRLTPAQLYILHRRGGRVYLRAYSGRNWRRRESRLEEYEGPVRFPDEDPLSEIPEPEMEEKVLSEPISFELALSGTDLPVLRDSGSHALWHVDVVREKGLVVIEPAGLPVETDRGERSLWKVAKVTEKGLVLVEERTKLPVLVRKVRQDLWLLTPLSSWKKQEGEESADLKDDTKEQAGETEGAERQSTDLSAALSIGGVSVLTERAGEERNKVEEGSAPAFALRIVDQERGLALVRPVSLLFSDVEKKDTEETEETKEVPEPAPASAEEAKEETPEKPEETPEKKEERKKEPLKTDPKEAFVREEEPDPVPPPPPTMTEEELMASIEAILFAMGDAVEITSLMKALGRTRQEIESAIEKLVYRYQQDGDGITILRFEDAVQMATTADQYSNVIRLVQVPKRPPLSDAMIETLSIIAWQQPVTRSQVEAVRGVDCGYSINKLLEQDFITEVGRKDAPGRPILFGTTEQFLRFFGIRSIEDLPQLQPGLVEELKSEAEAEVDERLNKV